MKYYCGPFWFPKWARKILSTKFNASCKIHDLDYKTARFNRDEADARFQDHMNRQAEMHYGWRLWAFIYYSMVRLGGRLSWKRKP